MSEPSDAVLKKIPVRQVRLGMHLHKLEGPWIAHPFWKTQFVIDTDADLKRLLESGVSECWIDVSRGVDVQSGDLRAPQCAPLPAPPSPTIAVPSPAPAREPTVAFAEELRVAAAICRRSRDKVSAMFGEARMGRTVDTAGCLPLVEEINGSVLRNPGALVSLARLKRRDDYSYMHSVAVCALMVALAHRLGMHEDDIRTAGMAGLMHDIGKALIPLEVLNKPGRLTSEEFDVIRGHPQRGHDLLAEASGSTAETLDVVLHHHERIDGTGYPHRLSGDALTRLSRMGAICDVYDAITSHRPYKSGWDPAESIAQMAGWKGQFDTVLFSVFVQTLGIYPTGSLVRLESGRLAMVVEQNPTRLVAPVVKVFYSTKAGMRVEPLRVDLAAKGCSDRIVGRCEGGDAGFARLDELWADPEALRRFGAR